MENNEALAHIRGQRNGALVTIKRDGRPQLSNVIYAVGSDDVIRISVTGDRAKTLNMRRDDRVSLHVNRDGNWAYVVVEGHAQLSDEAKTPDDATVNALVELYREFQGEHDDWDDYRGAMIRDRRLVVSLRVDYAYGMWS